MSDSAPPVCIVGMHRTGTSVLTDLLQRAGLHLGRPWEILGAEPGNPRGHFENRRFTWINDRLLEAFGGSWERPPRLPGDWLRSPAVEPIRDDARALLGVLEEAAPFGWKDPRTALVIPFWRELRPDLRFVVTLRSPLEVAGSLAARNEMSPEEGSELWLEYTLRAVRDTAGAPRLFVDYEDILRDPAATLDRVARHCGLVRPDAGEPAGTHTGSVDAALRHHRTSDAELVAHSGIRSAAKLLHLGLKRLLAEEGDAEATDSAVTELAREVDAAAHGDPEARLARAVRQADARTERAEAELARSRAARDAEHARAEELERHARALERECGALRASRDGTEAELERLRKELEASGAYRLARALGRLRGRMPGGSAPRRGPRGPGDQPEAR